MVTLFYVMPARLLDCPGGSYEVSPLWDRIGLLLANRKLVPGGPSRMFPPLGRMSGGRPFRVSSPFSGLMALRSGEPGPGGAFRLPAGTLSRAFGPPFRSGTGDSGGVGSESFSAWVS